MLKTHALKQRLLLNYIAVEALKRDSLFGAESWRDL